MGGRVRWWRHDLDVGLPDACAGPYAVVVCQRYRDPALYPALAARLAAGGLLVVTVLSTVGGRAGRWRAGPGELPAAFPGLEVLAAAEGDGEAHLVARRSGWPVSSRLATSGRDRRGDRHGGDQPDAADERADDLGGHLLAGHHIAQARDRRG